MVEALRLLTFPVFQLFTSNVRRFSTARPNKAGKGEGDETEVETVAKAVDSNFVKIIVALIGGGFGVIFYSIAWAKYFRYADYMADWYVSMLGYQEQLIDWLELNKFYDSSVPYMVGWIPANELRIDALKYPDKYTEKILEGVKEVKVLG